MERRLITMNPKNPQSENPWLKREVAALRAEEPTESAVERAVFAMQSSPVLTSAPRRAVWRTATVVGAIAVLGGFLAFRAPSVDAAELHRLADAARKQQTRHTRDYRPNENGELVLANEYWVEGVKHFAIYKDANGATLSGYNGSRIFRHSKAHGGFLDDTDPITFPVETIEDYLAIPSASIQGIKRGQQEEGRKVDIFTVGYGGMKMDLFIDPASGLPVRRDVRGKKGLIETNLYDYPADIPDDRFNPPAELKAETFDYPALRLELAKKIDAPGESQELNGVKITLHAVIVGHTRVVALWSGGAKTDYDVNGHINIQGMKPGPAAGLAGGSVWDMPGNEHSAILRKGQPLIGDGMWYPERLNVKSGFVLTVPVWQEDRSRPLINSEGKRMPGFHSKLLGHLNFKIKSPIFAPDPERVLWRPAGGEAKATAKEE